MTPTRLPSLLSSPRVRGIRSTIITFVVKEPLAQIAPAEAAIGPPTATARRMVDGLVSANTRRVYAGALRRLDAWLDGRLLDDVSLAAYVAELHDGGRASNSAAMAVAAACFLAKLAGQPNPAGDAGGGSRQYLHAADPADAGASAAHLAARDDVPPAAMTDTQRHRITGIITMTYKRSFLKLRHKFD